MLGDLLPKFFAPMVLHLLDFLPGPTLPFCSEAWDAISRYIYTGLQGGSIMKGWMKEENTMITCCSDGTRPVIFKIERLDYK